MAPQAPMNFSERSQLRERVIAHLLYWDLAKHHDLLALGHNFGKSSAAVTKGVAAHIKRGQRPVDPDIQRAKVFNGK